LESPAADQSVSDKKRVRAWAMYDFSTQGYQVTTASALLPAYFAQGIAPNGAEVFGIYIPPEGLWAYGVGIAAAFVFLLAPILGAIADYGSFKKRFLMSFAYAGCLFASLLFFAMPGMIWYSLILFVLAQVCYTSGNVFYDSFLPHIAHPEEIDRASGLGFAFGYLGGTLQFAFALLLVSGHDWFGLSSTMAIRIALLSAGLWWLFFSMYTFRHLTEEKKDLGETKIREIVSGGLQQTWGTIRQLPRFPMTMLFLVAFLFYNDGIQTVIGVAGVYGSGTLQLSTPVIMLAFLIVQFIAIGGALTFSAVARKLGTKNALMVSLLCWCVIVITAYFLKAGDARGFIILGASIGLILGGSQALSRSLFASIIPVNSSAGFFGFYSVFGKLSAIMGPILFGLLSTIFSSSRPAVLSIIIFFLVGTALLAFVDLKRARASRHEWEMEAR